MEILNCQYHYLIQKTISLILEIKFNLGFFKRSGYDKELLLEKEIEVTEQCEQVDITLLEEDTSKIEDINKPIIYWYEIALNESQTIIGYDDDGPAEIIFYPAKGGVKL